MKLNLEFKSWPAISAILFFLASLAILMINSGPILMDDTESYHIQSVKWIREFGSVPGLVNLNERFGFNSSWFSGIALFNFNSGSTSGFTVLNGVVSIWFSYWLISKSNQLKENSVGKIVTLIIFTLCITIWPLLRGNASTSNYDFIATFIVFVLLVEMNISNPEKQPQIAEWIIWPVFLFTVRIINFPLLLISIYAFVILWKTKGAKQLTSYLLIGILILIPFLIRNIILTGYPFYPAMYFDWFPVDWKADNEVTVKLLEYIKYYNRVSTGYLDIEQTKALGAGWIFAWFKHLFWFDKLLCISGIAGIVLKFVTSIKDIMKSRIHILMLSVIIIWLASWLLISPDPRFIYGVFLVGIFLLTYHILSFVLKKEPPPIFVKAFYLILITGTLIYIIIKPVKQDIYRNWVIPATLPVPPVDDFIVDGITFHIPKQINNNWNPRCYATPLPCVYRLDPRLRFRGKTMKDGFRLEK